MIFVLAMIAMVVALVVIHELGHFAVAKFFGVRVNEFGVGFPPKLFGWRKGETEYTFNAVPLGGFVRLEGEEDPTDPRSLASKSPGVRAAILVAGSFMNAVLAVAIFAALFMVPRDVTVGDVVVRDVSPNSPAAEAGIGPGDRIVAVDGQPVESTNQVSAGITRNLGSDLSLTLESGGQAREISLIPRWRPPEGEGNVGVRLGLENERVESLSYYPWEAVGKGAAQVVEVVTLTWRSITHWLFRDAPAPFSGPVGIVSGSKEAVDIGGLDTLIPLAALLSISLAIFNILPIPALDGGRLLFVIIEMIRGGKKIPAEKERLVHMLGFALLITLVLMVSYNDIARLVRGESFIG
jgi:regulator of sigma E protease